MSLEMYRRERVIVLSPDTTVYDDVRAMESHHIGAIVVQEHGDVVGIVTDRDLALRVIGFQLDPEETVLSDIQTDEPATLSIDATEEDAAALMRDRHVRRIPLLEGQKVVGIVTLDDLILSGSLEPRVLAEIVKEQLAERSAHKPLGATHPTRWRRPPSPEEASKAEARHRARAIQKWREFGGRLQRELDLESTDKALEAFEVLASNVVRRVTPDEARNFTSQLPSILRERLREQPEGPDSSITLEHIETEMAQRLGIEPDSASELIERLGGALGLVLSEGELSDLRAQLPYELRVLFRDNRYDAAAPLP
jgi:CBS domain-containing protein/uncharacterized protein (DUF2267 family)